MGVQPRLALLQVGIACLIAFPAASATQFALDETGPCATAADDQSGPAYGLIPGSGTGSGSPVTASGGNVVFFVATVPAGDDLTYGAGEWTLTLPGVTAGESGFHVALGTLNKAGDVCTFASVASLATDGETTILDASEFNVAAADFVAIRIADFTEAPRNTDTVIALGTATLESSDLGGSDPGYPVPGPDSFLVMAFGAVAVLGRIWMVRRGSTDSGPNR